MNYQHFQYPPARDIGAGDQQLLATKSGPPGSAGATNHHLRSTTPSSSTLGHNRPQPLRVTVEAIEPLFFALAFTIEYSLTVGKKDGPLAVFSPRISCSDILGGVTYIEVEAHNQALLEALSRATSAAKQLAFRGATVPLKLRVRVSRNIPATKVFFGLLGAGPQKHVIAVWEFGIIKTKSEVMTQQTGGVSFSFQSPVAQMSVPLGSGGGSGVSHSNLSASQAASPNTADDSQHVLGAVSVYSNDPVEIRQALHFILKNTFTAIDAEWYKELRVGDLMYEVDVLER
jgi:hypothetical protein